jgi:hypothetical protein
VCRPKIFVARDWPDPAQIVGDEAVELTLTYRGPLPACQPNDQKSEEKHRIRLAFAPQLEHVWKSSSVLSRVLTDGLLTPGLLVNGVIEFPLKEDKKCAHYWTVSCGYQVLPLVTRHNGLVCELSIDFLRAEEPGAIIHGGDLDNRLKTLLDALRMPLSSKEVPGHLTPPPAKTPRLFCLLEDDSLISKLVVDTRQIYVDPSTPAREMYADLVIKAVIRILRPHDATGDY